MDPLYLKRLMAQARDLDNAGRWLEADDIDAYCRKAFAQATSQVGQTPSPTWEQNVGHAVGTGVKNTGKWLADTGDAIGNGFSQIGQGYENGVLGKPAATPPPGQAPAEHFAPIISPNAQAWYDQHKTDNVSFTSRCQVWCQHNGGKGNLYNHLKSQGVPASVINDVWGRIR